MGRHVSVASLHNRIRRRRQVADLSQQELAKRCGLTRQVVNAIEVSQYVPNTLVALRLARALGSRVEELFHLMSTPCQEELEALGGYDSARTGTVVAKLSS